MYFSERSKNALEATKKFEINFVKTRGSRKAEKLIGKRRCLTISGPLGCGKKTIGNHLSLTYSKKGYEVLFIRRSAELLQCYHIDKKMLFVLHDPFGSPALDDTNLLDWCKCLDDISSCLQSNSSMKILLTCRSAILQNKLCQSTFSLLSENVLDLSEPKFKLSKKEIEAFLQVYTCWSLGECIEAYYNPSFPLICKKLKENPTYRLPSRRFDPEKIIFDLIQSELDAMVQNHKERYMTLLLILATKNSFDNLTNVPSLQTLVRDVASKFHLALPAMDLFLRQLQDILKEMDGFYLSSADGPYKFHNEYIYDMVSFYAGIAHPEAILECCSCKFFADHIHLEGCEHSNMKHSICLQKSLFDQWFSRALSEIRKGNGYTVLFGKTFNCNRCHFVEKLRHLPSQDLYHTLVAVTSTEQINKVASLYSLTKNLSDIRPHIYFGIQALSSIQDVTVFHMLLVLGEYEILELGWKKVRSAFDVNALLKLSVIGGDLRIVRKVIKFAVGSKPTNLRQKVCRRQTKLSLSALSSVLCVSSMCNHIELTKELLTLGYDVNAEDENRNTPLILAASHGYSVMLKMLISSGADANALNANRVSASALMYLVDNSSDFNAIAGITKTHILFGSDESGETLLMKACAIGNLCVVRKILDNDTLRISAILQSYVNLRKNDGLTALSKTCQSGREHALAIARDLLEAKADPNIADSVYGSTPLHHAVKRVDFEMVSELISHGAEVNIVDKDNLSPLYIAAEIGSRKIADTLIMNGADINISRKSDEMTPLLIAAGKGNSEIVELLLAQQRINVSAFNADKSSALLLATLNNHNKTCELLVKKIDVNRNNAKGYCPLLIASRNGNTNLMEIFLQHGADINCTSEFDGYTPLIMASMMGKKSAVKFLLARGACTDIKDNINYTANTYACLLKYDRISDILSLHSQKGPSCSLFKTLSVESVETIDSPFRSSETSSVSSERNTTQPGNRATSLPADLEKLENVCPEKRSRLGSIRSRLSLPEMERRASSNAAFLRRPSSLTSSTEASSVYSDLDCITENDGSNRKVRFKLTEH